MKIDKGVPVPDVQGRKRTVQASILAKEMVPGDSVLCQSRTEYETVRRTLWALKLKCTTRKEGEKWRVWRLE